jgi:hypothetical protein
MENSKSPPAADAQVSDDGKEGSTEEYVSEKIFGLRVGKNGRTNIE